jgi:hypothetical protein
MQRREHHSLPQARTANGFMNKHVYYDHLPFKISASIPDHKRIFNQLDSIALALQLRSPDPI